MFKFTNLVTLTEIELFKGYQNVIVYKYIYMVCFFNFCTLINVYFTKFAQNTKWTVTIEAVN